MRDVVAKENFLFGSKLLKLFEKNFFRELLPYYQQKTASVRHEPSQSEGMTKLSSTKEPNRGGGGFQNLGRDWEHTPGTQCFPS